MLFMINPNDIQNTYHDANASVLKEARHTLYIAQLSTGLRSWSVVDLVLLQDGRRGLVFRVWSSFVISGFVDYYTTRSYRSSL